MKRFKYTLMGIPVKHTLKSCETPDKTAPLRACSERRILRRNAMANCQAKATPVIIADKVT